MNPKCRTANTHEWKKGWLLRSGVCADLCYDCGSAYENFIFCNTFHLEEPGWRECNFCSKRLHCGCRASNSFLELLDYGGVGCRSCAMSPRLHLIQRDEIPNGFGALTKKDSDDTQTPMLENRVVGDGTAEGKLTQLCRIMEANEPSFLAPFQRGDTIVSLGQEKREELRLPFVEVGTGFSSPTKLSSRSSKFTKPDGSRSMLDVRDMPESLAQRSSSMSLGVPAGCSNFVPPFSNGAADGREPCKAHPSFQQGQRSRPILPKPSKTGLTISSETKKSTASQLRIARPPAEGRVTFSRIDPGGKLVMGFRKAPIPGDMQDAQTSAITNGCPGESSLSGVTENLPTVSGYSGHFQMLKGSKDPHIDALSEHLSLAEGDNGWHKSENHGQKTNEDSPQKSLLGMEKKRTRNIGSKSKRLLMHSEEAMELRLTWEEAQDLLRPSPSARPNIVTIEDHEFEEEQEQWAPCDDCSKWRKLPTDALLPPKWTCSDNVWDSIRCSCSAAEEMIQKDLENLLRVGRESKKRKIVESQRRDQQNEPSGLDALATAAVLGDYAGDSGEPSSVGATTTRHPRHRPGCTCIVCIQPPSGKGKHKPTCTCNVCMTVKRRFKTLMLRKKRRQSEREVEVAQKNHSDQMGDSEMNGSVKQESVPTSHTDNEISQTKSQTEVAESSSAQIGLDLNCYPNREDMQPEESRVSIMTLDRVASVPLEDCHPNGLASLSSCMLQQVNNGDHERLLSDERYVVEIYEELSSTIGVVVKALGSSVLVAINMLVRSAYSDSESVEVWSVFRDEEEEDEVERLSFLGGSRVAFGESSGGTGDVIVYHSSKICAELRDSVLKIYVHLIKTIADGIHLVFSLGDLTGYLVNFLSKLVEGLILSTGVLGLPVENNFILFWLFRLARSSNWRLDIRFGDDSGTRNHAVEC
ncbi:B3 domain-containing protein [Citrus sinensis]|nr:B3 domain-containing protein [Citrus sinensis]